MHIVEYGFVVLFNYVEPCKAKKQSIFYSTVSHISSKFVFVNLFSLGHALF